MFKNETKKFLALFACGGALLFSGCGRDYNGTYEGTISSNAGPQGFGAAGGSTSIKIEMTENNNRVSGPVSTGSGNSGFFSGNLENTGNGAKITNITLSLNNNTGNYSVNQPSQSISNAGPCTQGIQTGELQGNENSFNGNLSSSSAFVQQGSQGVNCMIILNKTSDRNS